MAQFTRIEVIKVMEETGMVPLFYHPDVELGKKVLKACYDGGSRLLEFTARGDFAFEVFRELNKFAIKELPGMFMQMGANFIVTPTFREDIAIVCNRRKVLWSPGCGTLTEINRAEELGCEIVKLFPGDIYGPGFVKAIKGPQPWTSVMPTGGVSTDEDNLKGWFSVGVTCVGMGSQMISKDILANKDFAGLEKRIKETLALIKKLKS